MAGSIIVPAGGFSLKMMAGHLYGDKQVKPVSELRSHLKISALQRAYTSTATANHRDSTPADVEADWSLVAERLKRSLRTDARAEADVSYMKAASLRRSVATMSTGFEGSPWRLAAIHDEGVSRAKAFASKRSATGLGAAAHAAAGAP